MELEKLQLENLEHENLELENRVWLAKLNRKNSTDSKLDAAGLVRSSGPWGWHEPASEGEDFVPTLWGQTPLSTKHGFGGLWPIGHFASGQPYGSLPAGYDPYGPSLDRSGPSIEAWGPMIGDRVVICRTSPRVEVLGIVLITGARYGSGGAVRYSHRALAYCPKPVRLNPAREFNANLKAGWAKSFGRSTPRRRFIDVDGTTLVGLLGALGCEPSLLCGPVEDLPLVPYPLTADTETRPFVAIDIALSPGWMFESRAVAVAIDQLLRPIGPSELEIWGFDEVEVWARSEVGGTQMTARDRNRTIQVVSIGGESSIYDIAIGQDVASSLERSARSVQQNAYVMMTMGALIGGDPKGIDPAIGEPEVIDLEVPDLEVTVVPADDFITTEITWPGDQYW